MNKAIIALVLCLAVVASATPSKSFMRRLKSSTSCADKAWDCELVMAVGYSNGLGDGQAMVPATNQSEVNDNLQANDSSDDQGDEDSVVGSQILRSDDGGITWEVLMITANIDTDGDIKEYHADGYGLTGISVGAGSEDATANTALVSIIGFDTNKDGATAFWQSRDGGLTYDKKDAAGLGNLGERPVLACSDDATFCIAGGNGLFYSQDAGNTFTEADTGDAKIEVSKIWCGTADCTTGGWSGSEGGEGVVYSFDFEAGTSDIIYNGGASVNDVWTSHNHDDGRKVMACAEPDAIFALNSEILGVHTSVTSEALSVCCIEQTCLGAVAEEGGVYYISENGGMTFSNERYHLENTENESGTGGDATGTPYHDEVGNLVTIWSSLAGDDGTDVWYTCSQDGGCYMSKDVYNTWTQIPASVYFNTNWVNGVTTTFNGV